MNAKHTPTPYYTDTLGGNTIWASAGLGCVAECNKENSKVQDAAFIVKAANAHDDLVAALAAALPALTRSAQNCTERQSEVKRLGPVCACFSHRTLRAARAALSKAGAA